MNKLTIVALSVAGKMVGIAGLPGFIERSMPRKAESKTPPVQKRDTVKAIVDPKNRTVV